MATNHKQLVTLTAATGHIASVAAELLLKKGLRVRAVGRSAARLGALKAKGAEPFEGSVDDASAMTKAFEGASSVFLLIPPNLAAADGRAYQNKVGEALAKAAKSAGVKHVVFLSSIGAHMKEGTGPITGLYDMEQRLNAMPLAVDHLRPVYFMENHLNGIGVIKGMGIFGSPMGPDHAFPQIATRDIGLVAAEKLAAGDKAKGQTVTELFGPKEYSMAESTKILGAAIGKPDLKYVQFPYDDAKKAMLGMGISPSVAGSFIEMYRAFNEGKVGSTQKPGPGNRGKTTLEEFAKTVFKPAFESKAPAAAH
jgi:uncharacterized protein YbjT (DUF2867 family)